MKAEAKKLIDMIKKGVPDKEIMKELGIQTKASLKKMYYDALVEAGKIKDIMTERKLKKAKGPRKRPVTIGKRGTILLSKPLLVEQLGFKEGDRERPGQLRIVGYFPQIPLLHAIVPDPEGISQDIPDTDDRLLGNGHQIKLA